MRVVNSELKSRAEAGMEQDLDANCLMKTVLRNFGGCTNQDMEENIRNFFGKVGKRADE